MGRLVYTSLASLDGYIADKSGNFEWAAPDEEVHAFINDLERSIGTYLLGRRMYETLAVWEHPEAFPDQNPVLLDFARIWQTADKIVHSRTLRTVSTAKTRIEREFDPAAVRQLKSESARDIGIGGPTLAAHAIRGGLVDEYQVFVVPVIVGGGTALLPEDVEVKLELLDERRFGNGMVYMRYRAAAA